MPPPALSWSDTLPIHPEYQDSYYAREDGAAESAHVFLNGNALQARFATTREQFCIAELGFGTGLNFLLSWQLWQHAAQPGAHLHYVAVEAQPLDANQIRQALSAWPQLHEHAEQLIAQLPPALAGFHHLRISDHVDLLLLYGDVREVLTQARFRADAWFLDGFAPARNPAMWSADVFKQLAALSSPGASFATYSAAGQVRRALTEAGFAVVRATGFGRKREMLKGHIENPPPRPAQPFWSADPPTSTSRPRIAVIGCGIVGASQARVLAERGYMVDVYGHSDGASQRIPALLVRPWPEKPGTQGISISQRFYQHAFESAQALYDRVCASAWQTYDDCGVLYPAAAIPALLEHAHIQVHANNVSAAQYTDNGWQLICNAHEQTYEQLVVCSAKVPSALAPWAQAPISFVAGQCVEIENTLDHPRWGAVHALPLNSGSLLGATFRPHSDALDQRDSESQALIREAIACWPELKQQDNKVRGAFTGVRIASPDHLPLLGPCPNLPWWQQHYQTLRHGLRHQTFAPPQYWPGLWLNLAHGSRGATAAALAAVHIAACLQGAPRPLQEDIISAVHPGRFAARRLRRGQDAWSTDASRAANTPAPSPRA